ncbi:MAG: D-alanyl-D-alanine carboxypeptidase [Syntrophales bacterium]|jgi:D-alanyl-D-alanine carboxypeptidase (penicillin-binding protein 5/6)|nr:D-alanyl-D-alanine carboxypeptidase [Syntrophales bacterium]
MSRFAKLEIILVVIMCLVFAAPGEAKKTKKKHHRAVAPKAKAVAPAVKSIVLMDMTTGKILQSRNANLAMQPASITKVLSLYMVYDAVNAGKARWSDRVRISPRAARTGGSRMYLEANTEATLGELVMGMSVVSANDACVAVAEHMEGSVEAFVEKMNIQAQKLGMTQSCFKTPNGLPAKGQYTTAADIVKLSTAYLERFPASLTIHSMQKYTYNGITHPNRNRLLGHYQGVDGLKTGYVGKAGWHIAVTAKQGDNRLLAVLMGANNPQFRNKEAAKLLDKGFAMVNGGKAVVLKNASAAGRLL